jgi:biotin/methionine sulfoxide reductase
MPKYASTHWGTYKVSQDRTNKIKLENWELDSSPTEFGLGLADAAVDDLRIKQPHVRRGWLESKAKNEKKILKQTKTKDKPIKTKKSKMTK